MRSGRIENRLLPGRYFVSCWISRNHNQGPPLEEPLADAFVRWRWRKAHREAWKNPPLSILKLRVARAEAAGVSYREYMLELLDTGRHLQASDVAKRRDKG